MSVISLHEISRIYGFGDASTLALDEVSLEIKKGEFVAIMGPSGSGKSTLMNIAGLLDTPSHGVYKLDGKDVSRVSQKKRAQTRREKIGFIFQSFNLLPRLTAVENVSMPLTYKGVSHVKRLHRAEKMLKNVDLHDRQYYMPSQLSGGQVQRVAVARALVNKPALILADEPTGNLDTASSTKIMEIFKEIHEAGNTIIMITHNVELAEYAERFIMMRDGKIELDTNEFTEAVNVITNSNKRAKAIAQAEIAAESEKKKAAAKAPLPIKPAEEETAAEPEEKEESKEKEKSTKATKEGKKETKQQRRESRRKAKKAKKAKK